jgi:hypothetical protein
MRRVAGSKPFEFVDSGHGESVALRQIVARYRDAGCPTLGVGGWVLGFPSLLFPILVNAMPSGLKRYYGRGDLHFITFSCYRRLL